MCRSSTLFDSYAKDESEDINTTKTRSWRMSIFQSYAQIRCDGIDLSHFTFIYISIYQVQHDLDLISWFNKRIMKKTIILISATLCTIGLMAFGLLDSEPTNDPTENTCGHPTTTDSAIAALMEFNQQLEREMDLSFPNFFYNVDPRFMTTVTKEALQHATSIEDFLPNQCAHITNYESVSVIILDDWKQTEMKATSEDDELTEEQLALLRSADYSTNILVKAYFDEKDAYTGHTKHNFMTPYITVVPEKQAQYADGKDALLQYLRIATMAETSIAEAGQLGSGKLYFTVNALGKITDVILASHCGYPSIDQAMMRVLSQVPGEWVPAENRVGEKVSQKLVFSYGNEGC